MPDKNDIALPLTDEAWPESIASMREGFAGKLNVYRVMAHNPALLASWATLRQHVVLDSSLDPHQREVVILRVGSRWGSTYEWGQHVVRGRQAGLTDIEIERARAEPDSWPAGETDTLLMRGTDALLDHGQLSVEQIKELALRVGLTGVFDLMATVGMYTTLAFIVKSFETPLEPEIVAAMG